MLQLQAPTLLPLEAENLTAEVQRVHHAADIVIQDGVVFPIRHITLCIGNAPMISTTCAEAAEDGRSAPRCFNRMAASRHLSVGAASPVGSSVDGRACTARNRATLWADAGKGAGPVSAHQATN